MVLSAEKRRALATRLNQMIDVPFLNEAQEQKIAESIINKILAPIESALPSDTEMTNMARSNGEETMKQTVRQQVVDKINQKYDIPGLTEAHEAIVFGMVVDFVMKDKFEEIHRSLTSTTTSTTTTTTTAGAPTRTTMAG